MNSKPYKFIFALLSFSLIVVLLLQGFWIKNFYSQQVDEFNRSVYQTLSEISDKLNERENINFIKESAFPKTKITKNGQSVKVIVSASSSNHSPIKDVDILRELQMDTAFGENQQVIISDSIVRINNNHQTIVVNKTTSKSLPKKEDLNKLLDKMLTEIKTIDVSPIEDIHSDSLNRLIKTQLESKGLFIPFDFQLKKEDKNTDVIIAQSNNFNKDKKSYKSNLSNNRIFSDHNYLYVQFPKEAEFLFLRMKNILLLSIAFSLIMIAVFYLTLKTILKQKKINDIKNDFINNMTHELKTPIATISLAIDAINNSQVRMNEEKFNQYTAILKEENQKLNSHVERVLQMALLDKSELQLHKKKVNLVSIINSAIYTHKLQIAKQHAQIIFDDKQLDVFLNADEFHIQNACNNLLDNALKYSKENCQIEITIQRTLQNVVMVIKDNGIGIDSSLHQKVFEKFYRVQGGNLHDVKGFGLGLSYVKSIIESHQGNIELQSEKNKGSQFIIKLPLYEN